MMTLNTLPPSTERIIQGYKEPLQHVEGGFGYFGTVAYNLERTHVQCHLCGSFFRRLGLHIRYSHDSSVKDYKAQFGLNLNRSLIAPIERERYQQHWESLSESEKEEVRERMRQNMHLGTEAARKVVIDRSKKLETRNLEGTCPDQLLDKISKLKDEIGHTPTIAEFKKRYNNQYYKIIYSTFGTWNEALKVLGMTINSKRGPSRQYTEESLIEMIRNFKKIYKREPYKRDTRDGTLPSEMTMTRYFGSWSKAKEAAFTEDQLMLIK